MTDRYLYLVRLHPDLFELKVGISNNPLRRLKDYKTASPRLILLRTWGGDHRDESAVIKLLSDVGQQLGREVIKLDPDRAIDLIDEYFENKLKGKQ